MKWKKQKMKLSDLPIPCVFQISRSFSIPNNLRRHKEDFLDHLSLKTIKIRRFQIPVFSLTLEIISSIFTPPTFSIAKRNHFQGTKPRRRPKQSQKISALPAIEGGFQKLQQNQPTNEIFILGNIAKKLRKNVHNLTMGKQNQGLRSIRAR